MASVTKSASGTTREEDYFSTTVTMVTARSNTTTYFENMSLYKATDVPSWVNYRKYSETVYGSNDLETEYRGYIEVNGTPPLNAKGTYSFTLIYRYYKYVDADTAPIDERATLNFTLTVEEKQYKVTVNWLGKNPDGVGYISTSHNFVAPSGTWSDKKLIGWSTSPVNPSANPSNLPSNYSPGGTYSISSDIIIYAVWQVQYHIHYDWNGGAGSTDDAYLFMGESIKLPSGTKSNTDYALRQDYWHTSIIQDTKDNERGMQPAFFTGETVTIDYNFLNDYGEESCTLYAAWTKPYEIKFANYKDAEPLPSIYRFLAESFEFPSCTRPNARLFCWTHYVVADSYTPNVIEFSVGSTCEVEGDAEYYAQWQIPYLYQFCPYYTDEPVKEIRVYWREQFSAPSCSDTDSMRFVGWSKTLKEPAKGMSYSECDEGRVIYANEDAIYYACWQYPWDVIFNWNEGKPATDLVKYSLKVYDNDRIALYDVDDVIRKDHKLVKWSVENVSQYEPGEIITITEDMLFLAIWYEIPSQSIDVSGNSAYLRTDESGWSRGTVYKFNGTSWEKCAAYIYNGKWE